MITSNIYICNIYIYIYNAQFIIIYRISRVIFPLLLKVIATGDDAVAVKSGLNDAGLRFGQPSGRIHLHDLEIHSKCLSIGSEMSGAIGLKASYKA